jgi:protein SCO1/2
MSWRVFIGLLSLAAASCSTGEPPRRYEMKGQILAIDAARQVVTIKHDDIVGFMPAMTMPFPVTPPSLLAGRVPGDLVTATLEVQQSTGRIVAMTRTGSAALPEAGALPVTPLGVGEPLPDVALVDSTDRRRSLSEWRGSWTVITFTYTRCPLPTFCPLMDQNFATLQGAIAEDASLRGRVKLISISFDPDHDTPAVLAAHARRLRADATVWTWLTGDRVTIDRLAARLGVNLLRDPDPAQITHSLQTTVVGPDGLIAQTYSGNDWTPGRVLADLRRAIRQP